MMKRIYIQYLLFLLFMASVAAAGDNHYPAKNNADAWLNRVNPFISIKFRDPLYYTFFEFQPSVASYGFEGINIFKFSENSMGFDSTEIYLSNFRNNFIQRNYFDMDLNIIRVNWLAMVYPQNILDYLNGFGVRRSLQILPVSLNKEWENATSGLAIYNYRPEIYEIYVSQALYYQPLESIFLRMEHSYALGQGTAYQTVGSDRLLDMKGASQRLALSMQFVLDNSSRNTNLTAGVQAFYHFGYYEIDDPDDITPLNYINMHSMGIGISLHAQFGARKSSGDKALKLIKSRNYVAAREEMNSYVLRNPNSPRKDLAMRYLAYCDSMTHVEYYKLANKALAAFKLEEALLYYDRAFSSKNKALQQKVKTRKTTIGRIFILNAMLELKQDNYENAYAILTKASELKGLYKDELSEAMAYVNMRRARILIASGLYSRADSYLQVAEQQNPKLEDEISVYRQMLAAATLNVAQNAAGKEEFTLAVEAMALAKLMDKRISADYDEFDKDLKIKLKQTGQEIQQPTLYKLYSDMKEKQLEIGKNAEIMLKAEVGMTLVDILDEFGQPFSRKKTKNAGQEYELLVYKFNDKIIEMYFKNYYLHRIDELATEK